MVEVDYVSHSVGEMPTNPLVYYTVEVNPNIIFQRPFYSFNAGQLSWYAGGGISLGAEDGAYDWKHMGYLVNDLGENKSPRFELYYEPDSDELFINSDCGIRCLL